MMTTLSLLVDTDILIKCACYSMLDELQHPADSDKETGILVAARFVVRKHLERHGQINDRPSAQRRFAEYLNTVTQLEPTEDELALATAIEEAGLIRGVDLDSGESQLCAIAVFRVTPLLLTGDKRAIMGAEALIEEISTLSALNGRIVCLEQALMGIAARVGIFAARARVCAEPGVDKSLAICFECRSGNDRSDFNSDGLVSYVRSLRAQAPTLLYGPDAM